MASWIPPSAKAREGISSPWYSSVRGEMCIRDRCDIPALQAGQNGAAFPDGGGAGEQSARQAEAGEQRGQIFVMLACQYFRGGHQGLSLIHI